MNTRYNLQPISIILEKLNFITCNFLHGFLNFFQFKIQPKENNSYLCNQLENALFCVTSGIFAGRAQRDPAKSHELHKIAFPNVLHTRFFLILTKKSFFKR
jgi:hypothetical protein